MLHGPDDKESQGEDDSALEAARNPVQSAPPEERSSLPGPSSVTPSTCGLKRKREDEITLERYENQLVGQTPSKRARKKGSVRSVPSGPGVLATYDNPSVEYPEWGRRCGSSASTGLVFFDGEDMCTCPRSKRRLLADKTTMG